MKSSKQKYLPLIIIAIIIIAAFAIMQLPILSNPNQNTSRSFTFNNTTYKFTIVATTLQQQEQGLMNKTVNASTFELFAFPGPSIYPFWMMDTYYPLDIIWINGSRVVYIVNATPCSSYSKNQSNCIVYNSYNDGHVANYVIEAQAGFVNRTSMHVGSLVYIH